MAVKKTETQAAAPQAENPELVSIKLFKDNSRYKGDLFVSVNGVNYQLQRGVTVRVPPEVAEVIQHSMEQDEASAARLEGIVQKSE